MQRAVRSCPERERHGTVSGRGKHKCVIVGGGLVVVSSEYAKALSDAGIQSSMQER